MPQYIAFLRSINVGGHTVKMEELRRLFGSIDLSNVETFIASGNVFFESKSKNETAIQKKIEGQLHKSLGYEVATFVRSGEEIAAITNYAPFGSKKSDAQLYIAFLSKTPEAEIQKKLLSYKTGTDDFHFHGRELYWNCHTNFSDSTFAGPLLEKVLQAKATVRKSTTIAKIAAKFSTS